MPGIGVTAWHQITGLAREGIQVSVRCPSCERKLGDDVRVVETMRIGGYRLPLRRIGMYQPHMWHDLQVARAIRCGNERADAVHCWPGVSLQTLAAARELGLTTFLERPNAHTRFACEVVAKEYDRLGIPMSRSHSHAFSSERLAREEAEYELADYLLCPSTFVVQSFLRYGFPAERLVRHQYGYDTGQCRPQTVRERDGVDRPFTIAFIGSCEPRKGLHYALTAWLSSGVAEQGRMHICGRFVPGYRRLLANMLSHRSVVEHGYVADPSVVMRRSHALVLPSIEEGSALVTYEARACGCVLLVSEAAGAPSQHMRDALVHRPGDVDTLRDHIRLLAGEPETLRQLRLVSTSELPKLTWQHAGRRLSGIYADCVRRAPGL